MKKVLKYIWIPLIILGIILMILFANGESNNNQDIQNKSIKIAVYDSDNNKIYDKSNETDETILADALKSIDELELITEDSQYGEYIISIMNIEQADDYYWNYYINDEYASVGISNCEINEQDSFTFKLEKFE